MPTAILPSLIRNSVIALGATAAVAASTAVATASPNVSEPDSTTTSPAETVVEGPKRDLAWLGSTNIPELLCPQQYQLTNTAYHPDSKWRIPPGVELRGENLKVLDASIPGVWSDSSRSFIGAGGWNASVTNWKLADNWVQMVLHCEPK
jgi:hypothetical protein